MNAIIATCSLISLLAADSESVSFLSDVWRVVTLQDSTTRTVLLGTTLLGVSGGIVGVFMLLRKRSLIGDVVGHSALPGIAIGFLLSQFFNPLAAKNMWFLVPGAFIAGLLGALCVLAVDRYSRLKSDAALAIVLSLFYGLGTALLTVVQQLPTAHAAGLQSFLNGKTATLVDSDVRAIGISAAVLCLVTLLLTKELTLLCFDDDFASATGWPIFWLDALLLGLVVGVTVLGMQTVGLILVVALLVIPAASARFWTDDVRQLLWTSACLGGIAAAAGTVVSSLAPRLAAGAVIVLSGTVLFILSLFLGPRRGLVWRWREQRMLQRRIGRNDLLRAAYELAEDAVPGNNVSEAQLIEARFGFRQLLALRSWSAGRLSRLLTQAERDELLTRSSMGVIRLTGEGAALARRAARNHRLWEIYLISYADVAPSRVDRDADRIEHILGPEMVRELERRLGAGDPFAMPASPHQLKPASEAPRPALGQNS